MINEVFSENLCQLIVDGIIKSCSYCMNNKKVYEILNIGNSSPTTLKEMIGRINS